MLAPLANAVEAPVVDEANAPLTLLALGVSSAYGSSTAVINCAWKRVT